MVFGIHLLAKRLAKSDVEVTKIIQCHVDEVDGFLQRTTEDFLIIHLDVRTRIQYLCLPLDNLDVFDEMLEDRNFRLSLVAYNDQIEHAVDRFTSAITDSLKDLRKGKDAMSALWHYLRQLADEGCFQSNSLKAFHQTMMDNLEGWVVTLSKLRRRGAALQKALGQLAFAVTEMQRRVGVASRKDARSLVKLANNSSGRTRSIKGRLFARGPAARTARPVADKPLPRDPLLKPKTSRPTSRKIEDAPVTAKDDTDPAAPNAIKRTPAPTNINRARSCSEVVGDTADGNSEVVTPSRTSGRLSRRFSKPFLLKRSVTEKAHTTPKRPSTAPTQTLKSRTASMEHLKAMWASGPPRTRQSTPKSPTWGRQGDSSQHADSSESMKDQISQYLKTDRVVEAWENITKTAGRGKTIAKPREWPSSIFRAKSLDNLGVCHRNGGSAQRDQDRQMSWLQEPELLNTYSFKQRPGPSPRIHVLSVQMTLDEDLTVACEGGEASGAGDTGSIITALPAVPPPTPASIRSISEVDKDPSMSKSDLRVTGRKDRYRGWMANS